MTEDQKRTELTENVAPALIDLLGLTDMGGAPLSQRITYANLFNSGLITVVGTVVAGDATAIIDAATLTAAGKIEIATAAETSAGTDATRCLSPDGFAGSEYGLRSVILNPIADDAEHSVGDAKYHFPTPEYFAGWDLIDVRVTIVTAGAVGGLFSVMVHNLTQTADICSTVFSIDPTELTSDTAATPGVIDTAEDDITLGDVLRIDFDAVHTTEGFGCYVELVFQKP